MGKVYYSQMDSRWGSKLYTSCGNATQTISSSGCGPTSAAMVISSLKEIITPDTMADLFVGNGLRSRSDGTMLSAFEWIANKWGLTSNSSWSKSIPQEAIDCLKAGGVAMVSCGNGLFTSGGHLMMLAGMRDDNTIIVHDPYLYSSKFNSSSRAGKVEIDGTKVYCSISNWNAYANMCKITWYNGTGEEPIKPVDPSTETKTAWVNTSSSPLNVRSGRGTGYGVVGSLPKGTQVTVYDIESGWARIGNGKYVSNEYLRYDNSTPTPQPTPGRNTVGQEKRLKANCSLWSESSLSGTEYNYLKGTKVVIKENVSGEVDKIYVPKTNRTAYINIAWYEGGSAPAPQPTPSEYPKTMTVTAAKGLYVRKGPGTGYGIATAYICGTRVTIYEISNGWAKGIRGWMSAAYLK